MISSDYVLELCNVFHTGQVCDFIVHMYVHTHLIVEVLWSNRLKIGVSERKNGNNFW